jgi:hypothetical protein
VVARERGDDTLNDDFIRLVPIPIVVALLAVGLSQNLDVVPANLYALRTVFPIAVAVFHPAGRLDITVNAV